MILLLKSPANFRAKLFLIRMLWKQGFFIFHNSQIQGVFLGDPMYRSTPLIFNNFSSPNS
jgi:hypothetical protein